jgi:uncharacterized protein (DUF1501 family)
MEIASRISSYELAFRMQAAAPELLDFSKESPETLAMYGVDQEPTKRFAANCLLARRMVERGVRFVMLTYATWDDYTDLNRKLKKICDIAGKPTAAFIRDLKQRGLLDSTLVAWGGEFGRTPMVEIRDLRDVNNAGRDHHPLAYSLLLAGGGIKGGQVVGKTGELSMSVLEDRVHVQDLQATISPLSGPGAYSSDLSPHGKRFPAYGRGWKCSAEDVCLTLVRPCAVDGEPPNTPGST